AVAQVVLNRVAHASWPGSVCGVVYQGSQRSTGCQFTFTCDGSLGRRPRGASWDQAHRIARAALSGDVYAPIGHATHYHTLWVNPYWAKSLDHVGTIGAHRFYRNRGAAGREAAFTGRYAGEEPSISARRNSSANSSRASVSPVRAAAGPAEVVIAPLDTLAEATGPVSRAGPPEANPLADPGLSNAGRARAKYANAGRWKTDPAKLDLSLQSSSETAGESASAPPQP
ncbi:MAG: cell wall hydrolase, partial [Pseudomonadota bacterium]